MRAGEVALIEKAEFSGEIKERLRYFNVVEGASIRLLKISFFKKIYFVQAGSAKLAIARGVAEGIVVCKK